MVSTKVLLVVVVTALVLFVTTACAAGTNDIGSTHNSESPSSSPSTSLPGSIIKGVSYGLQIVARAFGGGEESPSSGNRKGRREPKQVELALVGFGRTGTTSMVAALDMLGYTMQHDDALFEVSDLHGRLADPDDTFSIDDFADQCGQRGFDGIFFYSDEFIEWAAGNENVKVLLTKRDSGKKWAESWLVVAPNVDSCASRPFIWFKAVRDLYPGYFELIYKHISTQGQPEKYKDLDTLAAAHDAHLVKVRKMVPKERLLEFNVKQGWEPLCKFLDKPVPDTDFPHINDRMVAAAIVKTLIVITWIWPLVPLLIIYVTWRLLVRLLCRRGGEGGTPRSPAASSKKAD